MTVKELKDLLNQFNNDQEIVFHAVCDHCGGFICKADEDSLFEDNSGKVWFSIWES